MPYLNHLGLNRELFGNELGIATKYFGFVDVKIFATTHRKTKFSIECTAEVNGNKILEKDIEPPVRTSDAAKAAFKSRSYIEDHIAQFMSSLYSITQETIAKAGENLEIAKRMVSFKEMMTSRLLDSNGNAVSRKRDYNVNPIVVPESSIITDSYLNRMNERMHYFSAKDNKGNSYDSEDEVILKVKDRSSYVSLQAKEIEVETEEDMQEALDLITKLEALRTRAARRRAYQSIAA